MISAIKDYGKMVLKPTWNWTKKHWLAYVMFIVFGGVVGGLIGFIRGKIDERKMEESLNY